MKTAANPGSKDDDSFTDSEQTEAAAIESQGVLDTTQKFNFGVDWIFHATCFFSHSYPWYDTSCLPKGSSSSNALGATEPLGEQAVAAGAAAVGLSHLANLCKAPSLRLSAGKEYTKALNLTNAALCDPVQVKEDTTIRAVVCLSLFEVSICYLVASSGPVSCDFGKSL